MFSSFFDSDFDDLFFRPRRYTTDKPTDYNPRQIAQGGFDDLSLTRPRNRSSALQRNFNDSFWNNFNAGRYFVGFDEDMKTEEDKEQYLVSFTNTTGKLDPKDVTIDFHKKENELVISIKHEEKDENSSSSRTFVSSRIFDKPIDADQIKADITDDSIKLVLPKVEPDKEEKPNIVSVKVNKL
ncbi:Small heat shock protein 21 [Spathaspora sp. JA1]|nr:Small heat shock protein 21 [Spathaspora sp. JA1]